MKFRIGPYLALISCLLVACSHIKKEENLDDQVYFDNTFAGARLDSLVTNQQGKYEAYIFPAFEPVNKSPWFAFGISATTDQKIELKLNYGKYKHRYLPKLSNDLKTWQAIPAQLIEVDTATGVATLSLRVSPQKTYIAAQEVISSTDTDNWTNEFLKSHQSVKKTIAGKTPLGKDNNCLEWEPNDVKASIVFIARQHPPEVPGGVIGFRAFYEEVMGEGQLQEDFRDRFNIYTFPLLNPDGADLGHWRHNSKGADLNRDWIDFSQPETQHVRGFLNKKVKEGKKIAFAIDFHTSYSGPYFLILDSLNEQKTSGIIPKWLNNIEKSSDLTANPRRRSQELPYCYNYFYNEFGAEAITYEDADEMDRSEIRRRARVFAREFMKIMNQYQSD